VAKVDPVGQALARVDLPEPRTTIANPASDTAGTTVSASNAPIAATDGSSLLACDFPPFLDGWLIYKEVHVTASVEATRMAF
jgi:hypothetical protein